MVHKQKKKKKKKRYMKIYEKISTLVKYIKDYSCQIYRNAVSGELFIQIEESALTLKVLVATIDALGHFETR